MRTSRPLALLAALALTVGLGACGDDGDDGADQATTTTEAAPAESTEGEEPTETTEGEEPTEPTEPEAEGPTDEEAVALAESVNLTLEDFPQGWSESPAPGDDDDEDTDECFGDLDVDELTAGDAESPVFLLQAGTAQVEQVQSDTAVFTDVASAEEVLDVARGEGFLTCVQDALVASFLEDGDTAELDLELVEPDVAESTVGFDGGMSISGDGLSLGGQLGLYFVRTENVVTVVSVVVLGTTTYQDTLDDVLSTVADRQSSEVG